MGYFQSNYDRELAISVAQVLDTTADVAGSNPINLGSSEFAKGASIRGVVNVTALVGTLVIKVCAKSSGNPAKTDLIYTLPTTGSGATGQYKFTLPQDCPQYVNLFYTAGTSATLDAWLTAEIDSI